MKAIVPTRTIGFGDVLGLRRRDEDPAILVAVTRSHAECRLANHGNHGGLAHDLD